MASQTVTHILGIFLRSVNEHQDPTYDDPEQV
jgi:hypothetical protein